MKIHENSRKFTKIGKNPVFGPKPGKPENPGPGPKKTGIFGSPGVPDLGAGARRKFFLHTFCRFTGNNFRFLHFFPDFRTENLPLFFFHDLEGPETRFFENRKFTLRTLGGHLSEVAAKQWSIGAGPEIRVFGVWAQNPQKPENWQFS